MTNERRHDNCVSGALGVQLFPDKFDSAKIQDSQWVAIGQKRKQGRAL